MAWPPMRPRSGRFMPRYIMGPPMGYLLPSACLPSHNHTWPGPLWAPLSGRFMPRYIMGPPMRYLLPSSCLPSRNHTWPGPLCAPWVVGSCRSTSWGLPWDTYCHPHASPPITIHGLAPYAPPEWSVHAAVHHGASHGILTAIRMPPLP